MANHESPIRPSKQGATSMLGSGSWWIIPVVLILPTLIAGGILRRISKDPLSFVIPNLLLFTPFRELTHDMWDRVLSYDTSKVQPLIPVPELSPSVPFSWEMMRIATHNFRNPVVVRDMFQNTIAVQQWHDPDYLATSTHLGQYQVTMLHQARAKGLENDRDARTVIFGEEYPTLLKNNHSTNYFFFPEKSRAKAGTEKRVYFMYEQAKANCPSSNQTDPGLNMARDLNDIIRRDLELDRIWVGFGSSSHKTYQGSQFIAGWGHADAALTTGSNWHSDPGSNWFAQVHGRKRIFFLSPKYSAYMHPQRDGLTTLATSSPDLLTMQKHLPVQFVDLNPGDMVYIPDWQWHATRNHEGFSISVPIREFNRSHTVRANAHYTAIVLINKILSDYWGMTYGLQEHLKR